VASPLAAVAEVVAVAAFACGRKSFYAGGAQSRPGAAVPPTDAMDRIDRKILALLQENADIGLAELSDRVGLSQTPCWKRVQKLQNGGVILKRVALVSPERLGLGLTVFVSVETADHSAAWLEGFADGVSRMPEVMELYRMAGDVDYMLRVVVADMAAYDAFYKRLIGRFPLKNVTSRFAMERIKSTTALPIPPEPGEA